MIPQLEAEALIELAKIAYATGDIPAAIGGLQKVRDSGDPDYGPAAADTLGDLYCAEGEFVAGREAYRWAIDSEHPSWSRVATVDLAISLGRGTWPEREQGLQLLREQAASGGQVHGAELRPCSATCSPSTVTPRGPALHMSRPSSPRPVLGPHGADRPGAPPRP